MIVTNLLSSLQVTRLKEWFKNFKKPLFFIPTGIIILAAIAATVYLLSNNKLEKTGLSSYSDLDFGDAIFAKYQEVKSNTKPALQAYTLNSSELANLSAVSVAAKIPFTQPQLTALESTGFFTQPGKPIIRGINELAGGSRMDDMVDLYDEIQGDFPKELRKPENTVFISSDLLLHVYHILIDRSFQKIEANFLQPKLKQLTQALFEDSLQRHQKENDPKLKESLKRLTAFYLVPLAVLNTTDQEQDIKSAEDDATVDSPQNIQAALDTFSSQVPQEILQLAKGELTQVLDAKTVAPSPLYSPLKPDFAEDYTQYSPRSHYTKSSLLRSYFRTMMWYGRHSFDVESLDLTRDAALMSWQLGAVNVEGQKAGKVWESIYLPSVFFVGKSDDLTIYEYKDILNQVWGKTIDYNLLSDDSKLQQFQDRVKKLPGPKILSEIRRFDPDKAPGKDELLQKTKAFRLMGQRFIPDSFILSSLTQGDEEPDPQTGQSLPSTPTALMVISVLGSKTADGLLNEWVKTNAFESDKVINKFKGQLTSEFSKTDTATWTQNIYWSWLYNLLPLLKEHGEGYPMFMRSTAWNKKDLNSALGSWTELRHDTLLYAKSSYAELGGGGPLEDKIPPVPKGYVEPNLDFLTRLIALNKMTLEGLDSFELLNDEQKNRFNSFEETLNFYKTIAEKELSNQNITDDEYEQLRVSVGREISPLLSPFSGEYLTEKDARVALIADVHTDAKKGQILYEAIGVPSIIYVAVKDQGGTRLTRGATYSYYEFTEALGERLNDETWQDRVYRKASQTPPLPSWINELIVK